MSSVSIQDHGSQVIDAHKQRLHGFDFESLNFLTIFHFVQPYKATHMALNHSNSARPGVNISSRTKLLSHPDNFLSDLEDFFIHGWVYIKGLASVNMEGWMPATPSPPWRGCPG